MLGRQPEKDKGPQANLSETHAIYPLPHTQAHGCYWLLLLSLTGQWTPGRGWLRHWRDSNSRSPDKYGTAHEAVGQTFKKS